jgi:diguanylate cyclase (GGDEF)-like protein
MRHLVPNRCSCKSHRYALRRRLMNSNADKIMQGQLQNDIAELEMHLAQLHDRCASATAEFNRVRQQITAQAFMQQVYQSSTLAQVLDLLGAQVFSLAHVDGCAISLVNYSGEALVNAYLKLPEEFADIENTLMGFEYRLSQADITSMAFKDGKSRLVGESDLAQYANTTRMRFERFKMRSLIVSPLMIRMDDGSMQAIGTVTAFSQHQLLDMQAAERIHELGNRCSAHISMHWRYQQAFDRSKTVEAMNAQIQQFIAYITQMNSLNTVEEVYESISQEFINRFKFDLVNILLKESDELAMVHTSFSAPFRHLEQQWEPFRQRTRYSLNVRDGQSAMIFSNNQRFVVEDTVKILHLPMSDKDRQAISLLETLRTFMIVPIRLNGAPIGVMWLATLGEPIHLPETELTLIDLLSSFVSTAIRNAKAHGLVEKQNTEIAALNRDLHSKMQLLDQVARRDRLTGLNNFGNFEEELKRRTSQAARTGGDHPLSLILLDIDHFKRFNDTWGHPAGNEVLKTVAACLLKCVRDMDFVARYGGEEFAVLLPQCDLADAQPIAERIRHMIANEAFVVDGRQHAITISAGYAQFLPGESANDFIRRVDAALYLAKHNGRNRVELAVQSPDALTRI